MGINFDQSIKDMAPGHFWAHPQSLGLSESDLAYGYSQIEPPPLVLAAVETLDKAGVGQPMPFDPDDIFESTGKPS